MSRGPGQRGAVRTLEPADGTGWIDRRQLFAARVLRQAFHVDDLVDRAEPGRQPGDLDRPLHLACGDRSAILGAERREREADRGEIGAGVERVAELLEQERLLDEAELGFGDVEPAELRELRPAVVLRSIPVPVEWIPLSEPRARLPLQLELLVGEREIHLAALR